MEIARALVVAPAWIGDAVMAQPLLMRLRRAVPGLVLDALAPPWVAPVFERMPEVAEVIDSPFAHGELSFGRRLALGRRLRRRAYRQAYVLPNSAKSALIPFFAGIPERIGFTGETRYGLVNRRHALDRAALPRMVERFAQLAQTPGSPLERPVEAPRLASTAEQRARALESLGIERPRRVAVFCPGAEYGPAKRWPARHFAALADALAERGIEVWLLGANKDRQAGEEIALLAAQAKPRNFCGDTTLTQAIDLIAAADFVICNDSGLMHVAAALDRPLVAIYGSSSPVFTPPLSERAAIVRLDLACSPCFARECPLGHLACLNQLEPQRVLDACPAAGMQENAS
ncbi:MAG: lipopolysaccharide heptosyltransferase II [Candidatus Accumulibacter sp.]|jgi:heptosyltransferase-2|nr:lipopolysaccharide heptosyltransferase II [Accumulibacter sp.]